MLFAEGSPAKTLDKQTVHPKALPVPVLAYGQRCAELLERSGLRMYSRRTARTCAPVGLAPSSKSLPAWGMTHDGACWELGTRVAPIDETGCGSMLATPTAKANQLAPSMRKWPSCRAWWPTPTKRDHKDSPGMVAQRKDGKSRLDTLPRVVFHQEQAQTGGKLNPAFVESLMTWPIGWAGLEPLGMDRFHQWQRSHGISCTGQDND